MDFSNIKGIKLDELIKTVVKERCEITISFTPETAEVKIEPWQPLTYHCPYDFPLFSTTNTEATLKQ